MPLQKRVAVAATVIGAAVDIGYVFLIRSQGPSIGPRVAFFACFLAAMSGLALAGALLSGRNGGRAQALLYGAATGFILAGVVGLASIGLFILLPGLLAFAAAGPRQLSIWRIATTGAAVAFTLVIGLALT